MIKDTVFVSALLLLGFASCNSETDNVKDVDVTLLEVEDEGNLNQEPKNEIVYSIPSPNEQYDLLYTLNVEVAPTVINPLSNASRYSTNRKKALNFGIYISDAAYLMRYDQGKRVFLDYVSTLEKLGQDLDITKVFGEELINQVEEVGADSDRLFEISSQNYLNIYDQLIENEKGAELALILSGAWIETMYILFESSKGFNENLEVQEYIIDQRYVLENLMGFADSYSKDERVKPILKDFVRISESYMRLDCEESNLEIENDGGTMILNGGPSCLFTPESYKKMKSLILDIRSSIIS